MTQRVSAKHILYEEEGVLEREREREREREKQREKRAEALVLERLLRDLGITGPPRGAFTLLGLDSIYQISL